MTNQQIIDFFQGACLVMLAIGQYWHLKKHHPHRPRPKTTTQRKE